MMMTSMVFQFSVSRYYFFGPHLSSMEIAKLKPLNEESDGAGVSKKRP
ncbi:unnamed protein product [Arabidopsis halleri]